MEIENPKPPGMLHHLCTFDDVTIKQEFRLHRLQHLLSSCGDCCRKCNLSSTNTGCINQLLQLFPWTVSIQLTSHFSQGTLAHWCLLTWSVCKQLFYMRRNVCFLMIAHTAIQSCALIKSCFSFQASLLGSRPSRPTWSTAVKAGYAATRRRWEPSIIPHAAKVPGNIVCYWRAALLSQLVEATKSIQQDKVRKEFEDASRLLVETLKAAKYNGCYFDRTEKKQARLCTTEGWFTCQV